MEPGEALQNICIKLLLILPALSAPSIGFAASICEFGRSPQISQLLLLLLARNGRVRRIIYCMTIEDLGKSRRFSDAVPRCHSFSQISEMVSKKIKRAPDVTHMLLLRARVNCCRKELSLQLPSLRWRGGWSRSPAFVRRAWLQVCCAAFRLITLFPVLPRWQSGDVCCRLLLLPRIDFECYCSSSHLKSGKRTSSQAFVLGVILLSFNALLIQQKLCPFSCISGTSLSLGRYSPEDLNYTSVV